MPAAQPTPLEWILRENTNISISGRYSRGLPRPMRPEDAPDLAECFEINVRMLQDLRDAAPAIRGKGEVDSLSIRDLQHQWARLVGYDGRLSHGVTIAAGIYLRIDRPPPRHDKLSVMLPISSTAIDTAIKRWGDRSQWDRWRRGPVPGCPIQQTIDRALLRRHDLALDENALLDAALHPTDQLVQYWEEADAGKAITT